MPLSLRLQPTNHLDLDAVAWLEGYLKQQAVPMVVVSHDREFLDQVRESPGLGKVRVKIQLRLKYQVIDCS